MATIKEVSGKPQISPTLAEVDKREFRFFSFSRFSLLLLILFLLFFQRSSILLPLLITVINIFIFRQQHNSTLICAVIINTTPTIPLFAPTPGALAGRI